MSSARRRASACSGGLGSRTPHSPRICSRSRRSTRSSLLARLLVARRPVAEEAPTRRLVLPLERLRVDADLVGSSEQDAPKRLPVLVFERLGERDDRVHEL